MVIDQEALVDALRYLYMYIKESALSLPEIPGTENVALIN
jgi:hypothetical protein